MKYGVIEVTSDNMELLIVDEAGTMLYRGRETFSILSYVEQKLLSERGIEKICETVQRYKEICIEREVDKVYIISPKLGRIVKNYNQIVDGIYDYCGLHVCKLSGKARAYYTYLATEALLDGAAVVLNTGGCDTSVIGVLPENVVYACPLKLGGIKIATRFVRDIYPTKHEIGRAEDYIAHTLDDALFELKFDKAVLVGNAAIAIMRMCADYFKKEATEDFIISRKELNAFFHDFLLDSTANKTAMLLKFAPERLNTITASILMIKNILKRLSVKTVSFFNCGVIDGYIAAARSGEFYDSGNEIEEPNEKIDADECCDCARVMDGTDSVNTPTESKCQKSIAKKPRSSSPKSMKTEAEKKEKNEKESQ